MKVTTEVLAPDSGPTADLSVIDNDDTDPATIGTPFTYTLTVTNHGPDSAPEVIVTETLPPEVAVGAITPSQGSCTGTRNLRCALGSLPPAAQATITLQVIPTTLTALNSQAVVTSAATDPTPTNNRDAETTLVQVVPQATGSANLTVTVTDDEDPVEANLGNCPDECGGIVNWRIRAFNGGGDAATDVLVKQFIPSATIDKLRGPTSEPVKSGSDDQITCIPLECTITNPTECLDVVDVENILEDSLVLTCEVGTLAVGQTFTLNNAAELPLGTHATTVTVTSSASDPVPQDNSDSETTTLNEPPPEPESGGGGGGGGCFIATAAFGSPLAKEVEILRHFRDEYLLPNLAGQLLVQGYYYTSPPVATYISEHPVLKKAVQMSLWPVVWWAHLTLEAPQIGLMVLLGGLVIGISLIYLIMRVWSTQRSYDIMGDRQ